MQLEMFSEQELGRCRETFRKCPYCDAWTTDRDTRWADIMNVHSLASHSKLLRAPWFSCPSANPTVMPPSLYLTAEATLNVARSGELQTRYIMHPDRVIAYAGRTATVRWKPEIL